MYDPTIGRWIGQDPIGFAAGDANLYRYCRNSPIDATDPSGLDVTKEVRIDGYRVYYRIARGKLTVVDLLAVPAGTQVGPWGQPADQTSGTAVVTRLSGATSRVTLNGGNVCNTIDPKKFMSNNAGEIRVWVKFPQGTFRVLWMWEITVRGNALAGSATVSTYTPKGMKSAYANILLKPGLHDAGVETTCVSTNGGWVEIGDYNPTMSRSGKAIAPVASHVEGKIKITQIKRVQ